MSNYNLIFKTFENSFRFDNPFRTAVQAECTDSTEPTRLARSNSQISDSTLPDSEHTDRPQSSSLQSSSLHSDEESATETGEPFLIIVIKAVRPLITKHGICTIIDLFVNSLLSMLISVWNTTLLCRK